MPFTSIMLQPPCPRRLPSLWPRGLRPHRTPALAASTYTPLSRELQIMALCVAHAPSSGSLCMRRLKHQHPPPKMVASDTIGIAQITSLVCCSLSDVTCGTKPAMSQGDAQERYEVTAARNLSYSSLEREYSTARWKLSGLQLFGKMTSISL
jgi:hypothetical protein